MPCPSITNKGISKITPFLKEGASVTTTRAHVHYVVTEYGVVNLYGKGLEQRAKALISIAHPRSSGGIGEGSKKKVSLNFKIFFWFLKT